nr:uncharacterized protein LOC127308635 [Lolium perenne]
MSLSHQLACWFSFFADIYQLPMDKEDAIWTSSCTTWNLEDPRTTETYSMPLLAASTWLLMICSCAMLAIESNGVSSVSAQDIVARGGGHGCDAGGDEDHDGQA